MWGSTVSPEASQNRIHPSKTSLDGASQVCFFYSDQGTDDVEIHLAHRHTCRYLKQVLRSGDAVWEARPQIICFSL